MHPILRQLVYLALIFFVIIAVLQPYNRFCNYTGECNGIYVSDLIPSHEGKRQINAIMEIKNFRTDLVFEADEPQIIYTVAGRKNTANYRIQNTSKKTITIRPEFYVEPRALEKYIIRRECLCFREYSLEKGETIALRSVFKIDPAIEKDPAFTKENPYVRIGYLAKPSR